MRPSRRSLGIVVSIIVAVGVVLSVLALTTVGGLLSLRHSTCQASGSMVTQQVWLPLSLLNSPFHGLAFVNSTVPRGLLYGPPGGPPPNLVGGGVPNGTVWGGFAKVSATIQPVKNSTVWGPGSNSECSRAFEIELPFFVSGGYFTGGIFLWPGAPEFGPGPSDYQEPRMVNFSGALNDSSVWFDNGFTSSNAVNVSTCGGSVKSVTVTATALTVWIPFTVRGQNYSLPLVIPFVQTFHYIFPASTGIWQVDNLSAPGGPGGGWAFSYSPCA